ncbi:unnamed protein product, partial [Thlaspi arvense]
MVKFMQHKLGHLIVYTLVLPCSLDIWLDTLLSELCQPQPCSEYCWRDSWTSFGDACGNAS